MFICDDHDVCVCVCVSAVYCVMFPELHKWMDESQQHCQCHVSLYLRL